MRQVQSSNSVFVTRPLLAQDPESGIGNSSICAFAKCSSVLELHPHANDAKIKAKTATELLQRVLRVYTGADDEFMDEDLKGYGKEELFEDIPYSQQECEQALRDLIAFERHGASWQATPKVLLELWDVIIQTAQAERIRLEQEFDARDLMAKIDDTVAPEELMVALLCYLCQTYDLEIVSPKLDRIITVQWTGKMSAMADILGQDLTTNELLSRWRFRLPEAWRQDTSIEAAEELKSKQDQGNGKVNLINRGTDGVATGTKRPMKGRNWHERLKRSK